jgi:hypothetical protein
MASNTRAYSSGVQGLNVGLKEGANDGSSEGDGDGEVEGTIVGFDVGTFVGLGVSQIPHSTGHKFCPKGSWQKSEKTS